MSVFDLFTKPAPQQQQQQVQQTNQQQVSQHAENNPTVPNSTNTPTQTPSAGEPNPQSPNAQFQELWTIGNQQPNQQPNFQINPEQLQKTAGQLNFAKSVNPEDLAKVAAGGEEAVNAMVNILNTVGREVFSVNAHFASNMTEAGYQNAQKAISTGLPTLVNKQLSQNELFASNAKLRDPALQPLVRAIQSQITEKYPNATPSEVNSMVNDYFTKTVAGAFAPAQSQQADQNSQNSNYDFSSFLT